MIKKIAVVGPESTGKSALCRALAIHYKDVWVPEFAREYLNKLGREYVYEDLLHIAEGQLQAEKNLLANARKFLFCDTTLLTIKIWSDFKYGKTDCFILDQLEQQEYDLHLLCNIDLPWEDDPLREHPDQREELFKIHKSELDYYSTDFKIVSGLGSERIENAIAIINQFQTSEAKR